LNPFSLLSFLILASFFEFLTQRNPPGMLLLTPPSVFFPLKLKGNPSSPCMVYLFVFDGSMKGRSPALLNGSVPTLFFSFREIAVELVRIRHFILTSFPPESRSTVPGGVFPTF